MSTLSVFAVLVLAATPAAGSSAPLFQLFPVKGVFFPAQASASETLINPAFASLLSCGASTALDQKEPRLCDEFQERFREAFPDAAKAIDDKNKRRTFAVSLQVARASLYTVPKPNGLQDVYLPITASVYFTNVMTGEVLYAANRTAIDVDRIPAGEATPESRTVQAMFRKHFKSIVGALVVECGKKFQPVSISGTVRGEWMGLAILDAGRKQGLRRGDTLLDAKGNELRVVSAGSTYAIAVPEIGKFSTGVRFERVSNQLSQIEKARVLPLVEEPTPAEFPPDALTQVFADALGEKAPISLVPINRTFAAVLAAVGSQVSISQEQLRQRELPNFFVRLRVLEPIDFEVPTNIKDATIRVVTVVALGELVDRSGRVLFAAYGRNRIQDEVISGMSFSMKDRREVATKNALLDLARNFGARLDLSSDALRVTTGGEVIAIKDEHGMLAPGANWRTYRNIGKVDGIPDEVLVPTWDIEVTEVSAGMANAVLSLPVVAGAPKPEPDDVVFLDGIRSGTAASRRRFGSCGPASNVGKLDIPGYGHAALNVFATEFRAPFYTSGLAARVQELVRAGTGFKSDLRVSEPPIDLCVETVYAVDAPARCDGALCADVTRARFGYRVRKGSITGEVQAKHGLEAEIQGTEIRQEATTEARTRNMQSDVLTHSLQLNVGPVREFSKDAF